MRKKHLIGTLLFVFVATTGFAQKFPDLAPTPPMGWNSWNKFACNINEKLIRQTADEMVSSGMKDAGYTYLVIDDCWQGERDSLGFIHPDPKKFPSGMKALIDYVHSKGLKFGIYSDAGAKTCAGYAASRGHQYQDARTYAKWGVDYLKYDWCNTDGLNAQGAYTTMRDALYKAGRPILFSMCEWGSNQPWKWAAPIAQMWRTTGDIDNCFDCTSEYKRGVLQILDMEKNIRQYAGPNHWNDPDMLEIGNGMTQNEDRAHFTMWCMLAAPLIAGNDLTAMTAKTKAILINKEMIAIDQDKLGIQGFMKKAENGIEYWFKPLANGDWAVVFLNRNLTDQKITCDWKALKTIKDDLSGKTLHLDTTTYSLRNLWEHKDEGTTDKPYKMKIPSHDVVAFRLSE